MGTELQELSTGRQCFYKGNTTYFYPFNHFSNYYCLSWETQSEL